ncbi:MAG: 30S ribosomal protein S20 [Pirellulales bacterium]
MPHSASAKKRNRQNLRNRDRNRAVKSAIKSEVRKVLEAISTGDVGGAKEHLKTVAKKADQAAAKKTIHRNRAARIKSRLSARVKAASTGAPAKAAPAKGQKKAAKA